MPIPKLEKMTDEDRATMDAWLKEQRPYVTQDEHGAMASAYESGVRAVLKRINREKGLASCGSPNCCGHHNMPPDMAELSLLASGHKIAHGLTPNLLIGWLACRDSNQTVRVWFGDVECKIVSGYDYEGIANLVCVPVKEND